MKGRAALALSWLLAEPACVGRGPLVAFLGDSLTSGWKIPASQAYPALLQRALRERDRRVRVLNAGVSGETAVEGARRLPDVLRRRPDVLVVALGMNDGLRGLPLDAAESALREIVESAQAAGVRVLLAGLRIPPGKYGEDYARRFGEIYPRLAAEYKVALVPFLLDGVAGHPELNHRDGIHPNAAGHARLALNVLPHLELLLAEVKGAGR